jgi:beta-lactamase superfamily II metal-dependent hydrolase
MNGKIKLLNVGDGDAIIVHLKKNEENLVMVIDGGQPWHYEQVVKPALIELLNEVGKNAPDIVVATHYDSDHIGGLIPLVQDYIHGIKEVWVHRSPELNLEERHLLESAKDFKIVKSRNQFVFESQLIEEYPSIKSEAIKENISFVIESLRQLETFLGLLPEEKVRQVFHGDFFAGWPEIKVLGPTKAFFNELFPPSKRLKDIIIEETVDYLSEGVQKTGEIIYEQNPCQFLRNDSTVNLTPTNKASVIISIDNDSKRFLLTGDAGISSFKAIPNWETELKNIFWLKIPHHGSINNISKEIINIMKPEYADNSGDKYENKYVIGCISNNSRLKQEIRSTKTHGDISVNI